MAEGPEHEGITELKLRIPRRLSEEDLDELLGSLVPELASMVREAEQHDHGLTVVAHRGDPHQCPVCAEELAALESPDNGNSKPTPPRDERR